MSVTIKSAEEIELMRQAGKYLAKVHQELERAIKPGISTWEIDKIGEETIRSLGCEPNFLNYQGYPASICVSVNDEVVHGIPSKERILQEGDIVYLEKKKKKADKPNYDHVVQVGESMHSIAQMYGIQIKSLYKMNKKDKDYIPEEGDVLKLR